MLIVYAYIYILRQNAIPYLRSLLRKQYLRIFLDSSIPQGCKKFAEYVTLVRQNNFAFFVWAFMVGLTLDCHALHSLCPQMSMLIKIVFDVRKRNTSFCKPSFWWPSVYYQFFFIQNNRRKTNKTLYFLTVNNVS